MILVRSVFLLLGAALLEVGGDALIRKGLHSQPFLFAAGAFALVAYGYLVNQGAPAFSRMLGSYIAVFFVTSQIVGVLAFGDTLGWQSLAGGALIVAGGIVLLL